MRTLGTTRHRDSRWHLEHVFTGLFVRLQSEPAPAAESPRITATLAPRAEATAFPNWRAAADASIRYTQGQAMQIVRVDA